MVFRVSPLVLPSEWLALFLFINQRQILASDISVFTVLHIYVFSILFLNVRFVTMKSIKFHKMGFEELKQHSYMIKFAYILVETLLKMFITFLSQSYIF